MPSKPNWGGGQDLAVGRFPRLGHQDCYRRINDFLQEERQVRSGLDRLNAATQGMSRDQFRAYLATQEQRFGFAAPVILPAGPLLSPQAFLDHIARGQPLIDLSGSDKGGHGVQTHRVQLVMVGQWNEQHGKLRTSLVQLYRELGADAARLLKPGGPTGTTFDTLWDELLDSNADNATSPEQVFRYTQHHYGGFHDRMLWPDDDPASNPGSDPGASGSGAGSSGGDPGASGGGSS